APNAVLLKAPEGPMTRFARALLPPAVLTLRSPTVGLQPGALQTGVWLQPGVMFSRRPHPITIAAKVARRLMKASVRRSMPARKEGRFDGRRATAADVQGELDGTRTCGEVRAPGSCGDSRRAPKGTAGEQQQESRPA